MRDPLVLTGNPWKNPAATLAAPIPIISPLPSTSWPVRAANADAVEIVSVSATSAIPSAPATSSGRSDTGFGTVSGGKPLGERAHQRDAVVGQVEHRRRGDRDDDRDQHAGHLRQPATEREDQRQADQADRDRRADRLARREPVDERVRLVDQSVGVGREAEQLRQLADQDRQRQPVHVADLGRLGEQVGDEPELRDPGERS